MGRIFCSAHCKDCLICQNPTYLTPARQAEVPDLFRLPSVIRVACDCFQRMGNEIHKCCYARACQVAGRAAPCPNCRGAVVSTREDLDAMMTDGLQEAGLIAALDAHFARDEHAAAVADDTAAAVAAAEGVNSSDEDEVVHVNDLFMPDVQGPHQGPHQGQQHQGQHQGQQARVTSDFAVRSVTVHLSATLAAIRGGFQARNRLGDLANTLVVTEAETESLADAVREQQVLVANIEALFAEMNVAYGR